MGSQNSLYDPVRRRRVIATPEEYVRQHLIRALLKRGVPLSALCVEKRLSSFIPHCDLGEKRIDLVVATPKFGGWQIHLLAECKAKILDSHSLAQVLAYQRWLQSTWYVLAGPQEVWSWKSQTEGLGEWLPRLPEVDEIGL